MKTRPSIVRLFLAAVLLVAIPAIGAAEGLFETDTTLAIRLDAPWRQILRDREGPSETTGRLVLRQPSGDTLAIDAEIKPRGNWRLKHCATPPLTVKLRPEQLEGTTFAGQPVLYITTQCRRNVKYEHHLYQEYLVYRIYELLTDKSLRTRLVTIEHRDPERPGSDWTGNAFIVEDLHLAAERMNRRWVRPKSIGQTSLVPEVAVLFSLFQLMIGHTDWSMVLGAPGENCCHNAALLAPADVDRPLWPVPFDFDASGLVNTGDARPSPRLPIRSVRQRLYRGFCNFNPHLEGAISTLNGARSGIEALFKKGDLLTGTSRRVTLQYLNDFYEIINDPKKLEAKVLSRCRE